MRLFGLSVLYTMGCSCGKEVVEINGKKYTVKARLGEGGFSIVDLIQDQRNHQYYALKRIICHSKEDEKAAMQEVEYYNGIRHPNVVECLDASLAERSDTARLNTSEARIILPYFKRGTLHDELVIRNKCKDHMSERRILTIFRQMCEGMRAIHNANPYPLAHRDVKPANVLLTKEDTPVWMDFGSMGKARIEIRNSSEARALQDFASEKCSMPYRAPELFHVESHSSIDERVDVWSLGCCLYAMCFFKSPFEAAHERGDSIALAVIGGNVDIPDNSPYSSTLHGLIHSMVEVNALQRPFLDGVILQIDAIVSALENRV